MTRPRIVHPAGEAVVVRLHGGGELYGMVIEVRRRPRGIVYAVQAGRSTIDVRPDRILRTIDTTRLHRGAA